MSYTKEDFLLMESTSGGDILINISKVKFVIPGVSGTGGTCRLYFGGGEDDYVIVKTTLDDFVELL